MIIGSGHRSEARMFSSYTELYKGHDSANLRVREPFSSYLLFFALRMKKVLLPIDLRPLIPNLVNEVSDNLTVIC